MKDMRETSRGRNYMNKKAIHTLEFDKILEQLTAEAGSALGKQYCKRLRPSDDLSQIRQWQTQTKDALTRLFRKGNLSFSGVVDIRASLKRLEIGSVLGTGELLSVAKLLRNTAYVKAFGRHDTADTPKDSLDDFFDQLEPLTLLSGEIDRCIISEEEISDDASSALKDVRRQMKLTPAEAKACVQYQIGALKAFCDAAGVPLHHVKPHGALYNMAGKDRALADAICAAVKESAPGAVLLALSGSEMVKAAQAIGLPVANEVFADRGYRPDGSLVPRGTPGAMIEDEDEAIARVIRMVTEGKVTANDGTDIAIQADSVCVHGDGPKALAFVEKIGAALQAAGVELKAF